LLRVVSIFRSSLPNPPGRALRKLVRTGFLYGG